MPPGIRKHQPHERIEIIYIVKNDTAGAYFVLLLFLIFSSLLSRTPDAGHDTGLRWRGCHNSAASFIACAAGFPLKSVGGREQVKLTTSGVTKTDSATDDFYVWVHLI